MEISDYEQYYQKGGTYVLPIEIFNELWGEMESWRKECKQKDNVIKEVREYIKTYKFIPGEEESYILDSYVNADKLLEILDKENK